MPSTIPETPATPPEDEKAPQPVTGLDREPLLVRAAVVAVVGCLVAYGVDLTDEQRDATVNLATTIVLVLLPVVTAWWARRHVTPTATVAAEVDEDGVTRSGPADAARPNGEPVTLRPATPSPATVTYLDGRTHP